MTGDTPSASDSDRAAASFEELYERNVGAIYHFIYSKVGNREEAEDLTSQVFIKAVRGLDQARAGQSIQAWLFQVARTTVADHWREFYRLRADSLEKLLDAGWEASDHESDPPVPSNADGRVTAVLSRLPPRYRDVLTNRFLLNLSIRETATKMGLTEANVKVLQYRALQKAAAVDLQELDAVGYQAGDPHPSR
ncbi:MAG TPA: sigma-70 family RNA polymerase sigma factor [Ktedonobacterales bacterium]|nr:sigma-70 family RNA polymerase sigma factor [Ktedonobacterales bacterium]